MKRRYLWTAVLGISLFFFTGCSGRAPVSEEQETEVQEKETEELFQEEEEDPLLGTADLQVWLGSDFRTLDPAKTLYNTEKTVLRHLYETLLVRGDEGETEPGQAESYEVSSDGLTVTFHLRDDLKWSDGSALTSQNFIDAWNRLANPQTASPYAEDLLGNVSGFAQMQSGEGESLALSAPDEQTLVIELVSPDFSFPENCTLTALSPIPEDEAETGSEWMLSPETAVGNGPMVLSEYVPGDHLTLVKNPYYWHESQVSLTSITFLLNGSEEENLARYENGELDLFKGGVNWTEAADWREYHKRPAALASPSEEEGMNDTDMVYAPLSATYYFLLNLDKEPLKDQRVRQALSMVLDRRYIADVVMEGSVEPAWSFVGPGISDAKEGSSFLEKGEETYVPSEAAWNQETALAQAADLLLQAGYPGGEGIPEVEILTNDEGYHLDLAEYLIETWSALGIHASIREVNWSYFIPHRGAGAYWASRAVWMMDTDDPLSLLWQFTSQSPDNDGRYANEEFDRLMTEAKSAQDRETYYQLLHEGEQLLLEDAAAVPVAFYREGWRQHPGLMGVIHYSDGTWQFKAAYYPF